MRTIDAGVRDVVVQLNHIPGVTTRASCEGASDRGGQHRHADLAYVLLKYPMPLRLQEFLNTELGSVARVDHDGIYSRWPKGNAAFLDRFTAALHAYQRRSSMLHLQRVRRPLARLRARLARELSRNHGTRMGFCRTCRDVVVAPHSAAHQFEPLVELAADEEARWLADFVRDPPNALESDLIAADGWAHVVARTMRGDFGVAFQRRWLRYRARMIASVVTRQLRIGVEDARRRGNDLDFYYDRTHAVFAWSAEAALTPVG